MIRISLGRVGSGKTLMEVKEMGTAQNIRIPTYSNIKTKWPHQIDLTPDMIMKREVLGFKRDGTEKCKYSVNVDFWKSIKQPVNIVIDECHTIINSRRSMSNVNVCFTDWLSLIRRVIGGGDNSAGTLVLISQLPNRIDNIARDMANKITYHIGRWIVECACGYFAWDSSESVEMKEYCPFCHNPLKKRNHYIETFHFSGIQAFYAWQEEGQRSYYRFTREMNPAAYYGYYNTLQWDNLIKDH